MRHQKAGRKLGRGPSHRAAMRRNLACSLFLHERVTTTLPKAREVSKLAEKCVTLAKRKTLHARRRSLALLHDREVVKKLFDEIGPRYEERNGGYTRILRMADNRLGDQASQVIFELVSAPSEKEEKAAPKGRKRRAKPKLAESEAASDETKQ